MQAGSSLVVCTDRGSTVLYWTLTGVITTALVVPFWITRFNPLVDFGGHIARPYILANYEQVEIFRETFRRSSQVLPNMGYEVFASLLLRFLDPLIVGKLFLSLYVLLFCAGCHFLAEALHGSRSWLAPLACFLAYNSALLYGFVNYAMSLALFLLFLAGWLNSTGRWSEARLAGLTALATIIYLTHLAGFLCVMGSVLLLTPLARQPWRAIVPILPGVVIYLWPGQHGLPQTEVVWSSWKDKFIGLGSVIWSFDYLVDITLALVVLGAAALVWWFGKLAAARNGLILSLAFLLVFLILPNEWRAGGSIDKRFATAGLILLALSLQAQAPRRLAIGLCCVVGMAWSVRAGEIMLHWSRLSLEEERMESMFQTIERGSLIIPIMHYSNQREQAKYERAHEHFVSLAIVERHSVPATFVAVEGAQPVVFRHPERFRMNPPHLESYDYAWACGLHNEDRAALEAIATPVASGDWCSVWKIDKHRQ